jgi:hypothetical protein
MTPKKPAPATPRRFAPWSEQELALVEKLSADGWSDEHIAQVHGRSVYSIAKRLGREKYPRNACEGQHEQREFERRVREASARFVADAAGVFAQQCLRRSA